MFIEITTEDGPYLVNLSSVEWVRPTKDGRLLVQLRDRVLQVRNRGEVDRILDAVKKTE